MTHSCAARIGRAVPRRRVLGLLAGAVLAPARGGAQALPPTRIGLHLARVREAVQADPVATLRTVADIGYREVELWPVLIGLDLVALRRTLDSLSLTAPSRHVSMPDVFTNWRRLLTEGRLLGTRTLVCEEVPAPQRAALDGYVRVAGLLNATGRITQSLGVQLAFHPHPDDFRPRGAVVPYDLLLNKTDPALVTVQMDLALLSRVNRNPIEELMRYPGRIVSLHVNDIDKAPSTAAAELGTGRIDLPGVIRAAVQAGVQHYFVDDARSGSPLEQAKASFGYLSTLGLK